MLKLATLMLACYFVYSAEACKCNCDCAGKYTVQQDCCPGTPAPPPTPTTPPPPPCDRCPTGYERIGDFGCYHDTIAEVGQPGWSHEEAKAECKRKSNGQLLVLQNATMFDTIHTEIVRNRNGSFELYWVNAIYKDDNVTSQGEGKGFYWADGRKVQAHTYEWWEGNDPKGAELGYCLYAFGNETHNDCLSYTYCSVGLGYICEHPFIC